MIPIFVTILIAAFLYGFQKTIYKRFWKKGLSVELSFDRAAMNVGEKGELLEVVRNEKNLPLLMVAVKFQTTRNLTFAGAAQSQVTDKYYRNDVFRLGTREKVTRHIPFTADYRGYYTIDEANIVASDLFMTGNFIDNMPVNKGLYVYPRPDKSQDLKALMRQLNGQVAAKKALIEDPFEFIGIREYTVNDSMKAINWKASAKTGELMVNTYGSTAVSKIRIFMNLEDSGVLKRNASVEKSMEIALALCENFIAQGMSVSIYSNGKDIIKKECNNPGSGNGSIHLSNIKKYLARIDTTQAPESFVNSLSDEIYGEKSLLTIFISPNSYQDFCQLLEDYSKEGDFLWIYPALGGLTPTVPDALQKYVRFIQQ